MLRRVYTLFFHPGEVVEVRAIGGLRGNSKDWEGHCYGLKGVVTGYFDNADDFHEAATALDKAGAHGVYFSLNPCKPELLARAANRLKANIPNTTDKDIFCIRWLPIDIDPERPTGISSSEEELKMAEAMAAKITKWLEGEEGWPRGVRAFSGNGYHILYRLPDLSNTEENRGLIAKALYALHHRFRENSGVKIDVSVSNPARIWKLYGTMVRKGDSIPQRPHRRAHLLARELTKLEDIDVAE